MLPASGPSRKPGRKIWGSGQGVGSVAKVLPAAELIARFKKEYDEAVDRRCDAFRGDARGVVDAAEERWRRERIWARMSRW